MTEYLNKYITGPPEKVEALGASAAGTKPLHWTAVTKACQKNDILLVIDMQNDFALDKEPGGKFYVKEGEMTTIPIAELIKKWEGPVFATVDYHPKGHCSFSEATPPEPGSCKNHSHGFPPHCIAQSPGAKLCSEILEALNGRKDSLHDTEVFHKGFRPNVDSFGGVKYSCNTIFLKARNYNKGSLDQTEACKMVEYTGAININEKKTQVKDKRPFDEWGFVVESRAGGGRTAARVAQLARDPVHAVSLYDAIKSHFSTVGNKITPNIYVVGLAGDYSVLDTCRNLSTLLTRDGKNNQVYFALNHTRFAFDDELKKFYNSPTTIIKAAEDTRFTFVNLVGCATAAVRAVIDAPAAASTKSGGRRRRTRRKRRKKKKKKRSRKKHRK